jgi:hypothetical protein
MLYGSLALVLGTALLVVWHLGFATRALAPVFAEMMYARAPLIVFGPLALGCALGVLAALRQPSRTAAAAVAVEVLVAAGLAWIFLAYPFAARPTLRIAVGDRFPAFDLLDHRRTPVRFRPGEGHAPAVFVLYRGDW